MEIEQMKVYIKTPARLHMGLIDLNGDLGRIFGGIGVGIETPNVIVEAQPSEKLTITGEENQLVQTLAKRFFDTYKTKTAVNINVKQAIPSHVGLGSGTQLSLAIATALSKVLKIEATTQELAIVMGRARRTGVGTAIFQKGGLVVDGGKITKNGVVSESFPPLIFRQEFPRDWRFVVVVPNVKKGLTSQEENSAFKKLTPMPAESVGKICRLTMLKLLPALAEHDIQNFGEALTNIQIITGEYFAQAQGGTYASSASNECIQLMQKSGVHGVGQSSWGPALYGSVQKEQAKQVAKKVQAYLNKTIGGEVFIVKPNNSGAVIKSTL
jgi:beta-ribofuranosylaminobenzene 5'-phosphate synthase